MPDDYKNNAVIFPPPERMKPFQYAPYPSLEIIQALEDILTRLRAVAG